ncbi:nucleotidyltransferase domain-containing protein [candidate division KSB1 bacterium]|nr:nucleotidyltransferase domain-containing protein [candidate division KSB1 bacterium]NIR70202.1 nucleotidyltransferase domain-containing protein [candidate division KSB1 bacterium]NIS27589.1 nucleotidyltransferase domain-containing protein [candidate division KSB1 bacterium]NIT74441.1 nucleotidyltransferase domain-containing protein [candidate division KSB1 bacterium]NIU28306.1 nucleotidyltransferase domain-containing protein [candidate division KSB1 bacterium]
MKPQKIISELKQSLQTEVKFALVYGSILTKYFKKDSDIDLGVYLGKKPDLDTYIDLKQRIEQHFDYQFEIDPVIFDNADPIIAMQILANGELIIKHDLEPFIKYKARMISQYLDFKMDRKRIEERIAEGSVYA